MRPLRLATKAFGLAGTTKCLACNGLNHGQRVLHPVVQLVDKQDLMLFRAFALSDVDEHVDCADHFPVAEEWCGIGQTRHLLSIRPLQKDLLAEYRLLVRKATAIGQLSSGNSSPSGVLRRHETHQRSFPISGVRPASSRAVSL